jgi:hypothetical protein
MTSKIVLRDVDQFMDDYQPIYQPLYPLLLGNSQSYTSEVGKLNFKRMEAVSDIRAKHVTPKDTEMQQIGAKESSKTFKKYFLANQFIRSQLQSGQQDEDIIRQVLDEHQLQMDEIALLGEGTADNNVVNNGVFYSGDANHTTENSVELDTDNDTLIDIHAKVIQNTYKADQVAGRKVIVFYGADVLGYYDSLFAASSKAFRAALAESLGPNYSFAKMPPRVTPSSVNGWIIINLDQVKFHYTVLPQLRAQGVNEEKMYTWHNFVMGSCMVECLAQDAIIRQPATIEA